jgi:hypothetical protein
MRKFRISIYNRASVYPDEPRLSSGKAKKSRACRLVFLLPKATRAIKLKDFNFILSEQED